MDRLVTHGPSAERPARPARRTRPALSALRANVSLHRGEQHANNRAALRWLDNLEHRQKRERRSLRRGYRASPDGRGPLAQRCRAAQLTLRGRAERSSVGDRDVERRESRRVRAPRRKPTRGVGDGRQDVRQRRGPRRGLVSCCASRPPHYVAHQLNQPERRAVSWV
ncbi:hypothetical protein T492DRAFT_234505 [Pavlovales sp. CCMP2436]|nr:hypothetical protein T492DRAFT_234505 [Pavlovales sp. CCMP2436]